MERKGFSGYEFLVESKGKWTLSCAYNKYCNEPIGYGNVRHDGQRNLASGGGVRINPVNGNRIRIDVKGARITIWVDDGELADLTDDQMTREINGVTLDHGGVGTANIHEVMFEVRDFEARRL